MKSERFKNSAVLLLAAIVAGCSQIAVVSEKPPARFRATSGTNQAIAQTIDRAQALDRSQPQAALEAYVNAARDSLPGGLLVSILTSSPRNLTASAWAAVKSGCCWASANVDDSRNVETIRRRESIASKLRACGRFAARKSYFFTVYNKAGLLCGHDV